MGSTTWSACCTGVRVKAKAGGGRANAVPGNSSSSACTVIIIKDYDLYLMSVCQTNISGTGLLVCSSHRYRTQ